MTRLVPLAIALSFALSAPLHAGETPIAGAADNAALLAKIAQLEARITALEAERASAPHGAAPAALPAIAMEKPRASAKVHAPEQEAFDVKLHGLLQVDARQWGGQAASAADGFLLRRAEPTLDGRWGERLSFRLSAQLAGDTASVNDAYFDLKLAPHTSLRMGRFKPALGLERLQSSATTASIELGLPSELAPGRDYGLQVHGEFAAAGVSYALGLFNGAVDGRDAAASNPDGQFEWVGRVFFEPWKRSDTAWSGLGFGVAVSQGDKHGSGNAALPRYRTPGQQSMFAYRSTVSADGAHTRYAPQGYYYRGRLGMLGEYTRSQQQLRSVSGAQAQLNHRAWQWVASWVLSGEAASYKGVQRPARPFTLDGEGWGALELVGRYGRLEIDDRSFPLFADPATASAAARSWGVGVNWYLDSHVKLMADYLHTGFDAAPGGQARENENAIFARAQLAF